jgi:hypothetical protein
LVAIGFESLTNAMETIHSGAIDSNLKPGHVAEILFLVCESLERRKSISLISFRFGFGEKPIELVISAALWEGEK